MFDNSTLEQLKSLKTQIRKENPILRGVVIGTPGRHGFVRINDTKRNIYISPENMIRVLPGDTLDIKIGKDAEQNKEFAIFEKFIKSELKVFCGQIVKKNNNTFVQPDVPMLSRWLFVPPAKAKDLNEGDYVEAKITRHPFKNGKPQVEISRVIGAKNEVGIEVKYACVKHGLSNDYDDATSAQMLADAKARFDKALSERSALDDRFFVTIDGESTRDIDDALAIEKQGDGYQLSIAIADPAELIYPEDTAFKELQKRGQTAYLPGAKIALLPAALSEDLCSLIAGENRLALVATFAIDNQGLVTDLVLEERSINVSKRLSYNEVDSIIASPQSDEVGESISLLNELAQKLKQQRHEHQLVMPDKADYDYVLDEQMHIKEIIVKPSSPSRHLVEECMLLINSRIATYALEHKVAIPFTAHAGFKPERLDFIKTAIKKLYPESAEAIVQNVVEDPAILADINNYKALIRFVQANPVAGEPYTLLSKQLTRSHFTQEVEPHFGLGLEAYTTFTSPIRKLQDFTVHQQLKAHLKQGESKLDAKLIEHITDGQSRFKQSSRLVEQWLHCHYLNSKKDQTFEAKVTHLNSRSITLTLTDSAISGQVETRAIKAKCSFDPSLMKMTCGDELYQLNQIVTVSVKKIDFNTRQIFFKFGE